MTDVPKARWPGRRSERGSPGGRRRPAPQLLDLAAETCDLGLGLPSGLVGARPLGLGLLSCLGLPVKPLLRRRQVLPRRRIVESQFGAELLYVKTEHLARQPAIHR